MVRLVDTHAHLDEIEDLEKALDEARQVGITAIIAVGQDLKSNKKVLDIARRFEGLVYPAFGLHPWNLDRDNLEPELDFIRANISGAVAVGEIGLDYHKRVREKSDKATQAQALRKLLEIAGNSGKPALLHTRYAWRDALELVKEAQLEKAVFHWYTGTSSVLRDIIDLGYHVSVTPAVEYHEEHRRAIKATPLEKLLLETDCPVVYGRGSEHEFESRPADIVRSLTGAAELTGIDEQKLADASTDNALRLFGIGSMT